MLVYTFFKGPCRQNWRRPGVGFQPEFPQALASFKLVSLCLISTFKRSYCCLVTNSCRTLCDPKDCIPPGSFVHGIFQVLELVAFSFSMGASCPRDQTCISCTGRQIFSHWAIWEAQKTLLMNMNFFLSQKCYNSTRRPTTPLRK